MNKWWPEWYGLTDEQVDDPEPLESEFHRYQYMRWLVSRIATDIGYGSPWEIEKNKEAIMIAKRDWDNDNEWIWTSWANVDLMAFLLGHTQFIDGPWGAQQ